MSQLSEDSCKLLFGGIFRTLDDLLKRDRHMLEDDVESCLCCKSAKSFDNMAMSDAIMHIQRLLSSCNREGSYDYQSRVWRFPLCHSNRAVEVEIKNLCVDILW